MRQLGRISACATAIVSVAAVCAQTKPQAPKIAVAVPVAAHTFALGTDDFLLDKQPFQIMCEDQVMTVLYQVSIPVFACS